MTPHTYRVRLIPDDKGAGEVTSAEVSASAKLLAVDVETTGLDHHTDQLRTIQVATSPYQVSVFRVDKLDRDELAEYLLPRIRAARRVTAHNATFDLQWLESYFGVPLMEELYSTGRVFDTFVGWSVSDHPWQPYQHRTLKHAASLVVDDYNGDEDKVLKTVFRDSGWDWSTIPDDHPVFVRYAASDAYAQWQLANQLLEHETDTVRHETFIDYLYHCMADKGLMIDRVAATSLKQSLLEEASSLREEFTKLGLNPNSTMQLAEHFTRRGYRLTELTPTGKKKVDAAVLTRLRDEGSVLASHVLTTKRNEKMVKSYIDPLINTVGPCRPQVHSLGAITTRSSVSNPPLQQLPREDTRVRGLLVARAHHTLVSVDYTQVELRLLAELSREPKMVASLANGEDFHSATSETLFSSHDPHHRSISKNLNFGVIYGGGAATLSRMAGITEGEARGVIDRWRQSYPQAWNWMRQVIALTKRQGFVQLWEGGPKVYVDRDGAFKAVNYIIQGQAANILKQAVTRLHEAELWQYARLVIHDEVLFEVPKEERVELTQAALRIMATDGSHVSFPCEAKHHGERWGGTPD